MCSFISKFIYALLSLDMNIIGLVLGFIGGILITLFGLPSLGVLGEILYAMDPPTPKIKLYNKLSYLGLFLVMVGFLLQLIPAVQLVQLP